MNVRKSLIGRNLREFGSGPITVASQPRAQSPKPGSPKSGSRKPEVRKPEAHRNFVLATDFRTEYSRHTIISNTAA